MEAATTSTSSCPPGATVPSARTAPGRRIRPRTEHGLRVGGVGLGRQAREDHVPAVLASEMIELVAVCDTDPDTLAAAHLDLGAGYHSTGDMWPPVDSRSAQAVVSQLLCRVSIPDRSGAVAELETRLAGYFGVRHAVLTSSGTAALHSAYASLDLRGGDEVLVPAYTSTESTRIRRQSYDLIDAQTDCGATVAAVPLRGKDAMPSMTSDIAPCAVLVTGAAGLIGVPVVRVLRARGFRVVAIDDGSAGTLHRLDEFADCAEVQQHVLDIRQRSELVRLMAAERPWAMVHLAAQHFIPACDSAPAETLAINVLGTQHVLDACAVHPPQRLLFASTADVYPPSEHPHHEDDPVGPQGVYGWSKLFGERLLRDQAHRLGRCTAVVARLFNVYGPGDPHPHLLPEVLRQTRRGQTLRLGDLDAARDFVYVDDVADVLLALLRTPCAGVFNVGAGVRVGGRELVDLVASLTGRHLETRIDPERLRHRSRRVSCANSERLRQIVPWWPHTPLREGVRRTIAADRRADAGESECKAS